MVLDEVVFDCIVQLVSDLSILQQLHEVSQRIHSFILEANSAYRVGLCVDQHQYVLLSAWLWDIYIFFYIHVNFRRWRCGCRVRAGCFLGGLIETDYPTEQGGQTCECVRGRHLVTRAKCAKTFVVTGRSFVGRRCHRASACFPSPYITATFSTKR